MSVVASVIAPLEAFVAEKSTPETTFPAFSERAEATSAPPDRMSPVAMSAPAVSAILLKLTSEAALIEPDVAVIFSAPPPALAVPESAMLPDSVVRLAAPSALIWPAEIPCPARRLAFFAAATLPVTITPDEVSSILPREAASPAIDRRPVSEFRMTSSSAETASKVMPLAAFTTTRFLDVTFLASTCLFFDWMETPSRPDALPSDILPSAESVSSPA